MSARNRDKRQRRIRMKNIMGGPTATATLPPLADIVANWAMDAEVLPDGFEWHQVFGYPPRQVMGMTEHMFVRWQGQPHWPVRVSRDLLAMSPDLIARMPWPMLKTGVETRDWVEYRR